MPIHECILTGGGKGFQWGGKGKCYPTRAEAEKQAQAAYSNGYTGDEELIDSLSLTDSFVLDGVHRSKDGYLAAYAKVARTGIQTYKGRELGRPDLEDVKVYRPPEEVFHQDAMHSMAHRPVTLHHPNETVNAKNWKKYAKGHTGDEVIRDGDHIRVPVVVMDAETIQAFENKDACELSMGYSTDLKWTPGTTPEGLTYDAVQTAIRANHLAIVPVARGGSTLKLGDIWSEEARAAALEARKRSSSGEDDTPTHHREAAGSNVFSTPEGKKRNYENQLAFEKANESNHNIDPKKFNAPHPEEWYQLIGATKIAQRHESRDSFRDLVQRMNDNVVEMEDDETCPVCGEDVAIDDDICPHCGADLDEDDDMNDAVELEDEHLDDSNPNHDPQTGRFTSAENVAAAKTLKEQHNVSFRAQGVGKETKFFHTPPGGIEHGPFDIYSRAINHAAGVVGAPHINVPEVENLDRRSRRKQLREAKKTAKGSSSNALVPYSGGGGITVTGSNARSAPGRFNSKHEAKEFIRKNRRIWRNARVVTTVEKTKEPYHTKPFESLGYGLSSLGIAHRTRKKSFHVHHDAISPENKQTADAALFRLRDRANESVEIWADRLADDLVSHSLQDEWLDDDGECSIVFDADSELQDECLEDSLIDEIDGEPIEIDDYDSNEPRDERGRWTQGELEVAGYTFGFRGKSHHVQHTAAGFHSGPHEQKTEAIEKAGENASSRLVNLKITTKEELKKLGYNIENRPGAGYYAVNSDKEFNSNAKSTEKEAIKAATEHANYEQLLKHQIRLKEYEQRNNKTQLPAVIPPAPTTPALSQGVILPTNSVSPKLKTQAGSPFIVRQTPTSFESPRKAREHIANEIAYWKNAKVLTQKVTERENLFGGGFVGRHAGSALAKVGIMHRTPHYFYSIKSSRDSAVTDAANDDSIGNSNIGDNEMAKMITIDSVPVETTDVGAAVIQRYVAKLEGDLKSLQDAWNDKKKKDAEEEAAEGETKDGFKKQVEAKDGEIAVLKKQLADAQLSPEKLDALVKDRATVIDSARTVLDSHFVFDGKKVEDIRRAAVGAKLGDAVAKEMSDAAVEGAFKALTIDAKPSSSAGGTRPLARALFDQQSNGSRPGTDLRDAALAEREKYLNTAWQGRPTGNNN